MRTSSDRLALWARSQHPMPILVSADEQEGCQHESSPSFSPVIPPLFSAFALELSKSTAARSPFHSFNMTDYFSLPLMNVYTFNHDTRKLSSKHMRLPASSDTTSPTLVYTPGTSDGLTLELVVVGSGRAVYFLQTPTNETSPQQAAARDRAVRKAKRKVQELERMAEQLEQALLGDLSPPADW